MRLVLVGLWAATLWAQAEISGARIREHVKFLASDLLEGRGVGPRGGDLATAYLASQMALVGVEPAGDNGTFFQRVDLVGVEPQSSAKLSLGASELTWAVDFVGNTMQQKSLAEFGAEAVLVADEVAARRRIGQRAGRAGARDHVRTRCEGSFGETTGTGSRGVAGRCEWPPSRCESAGRRQG